MYSSLGGVKRTAESTQSTRNGISHSSTNPDRKYENM